VIPNEDDLPVTFDFDQEPITGLEARLQGVLRCSMQADPNPNRIHQRLVD
jgi:hypothetical protein